MSYNRSSTAARDRDSPTSDASSEHSSQSSSPASPATFAGLPPSEETGASTSSSSNPRGTPQRVAINLPRTHSAGKGGCWTCRLRRKKCDEQREGESCQTCLRLSIKCLGWGPRRPEWLREKQAQEAYKAEIKEQLMREGKIRGQPKARRTPPMGGYPSFLQPPDMALPGVAGPGPSSGRGREMPNEFDLGAMFGFNDPMMAHSPFASPHDSPFIPGSFSGNMNTLPMAPGSIMIPAGTASTMSASTSPAVASGLTGASGDGGFHGLPTPGGNDLALAFDPLYPAATDPTSAMRQDYVRFYFEHVRKLVFPFASEAIDAALNDLIQHEPDGGLVDAMCALASLHYARTSAQTHGADLLATSKPFFEQAYYHISSSFQLNGQYTETDAIISIHLIGYSLLAGGVTDWPTLLEIACEWLSQSILLTEDNPKLVMLNMSVTGRFAVKATMWYDIVSSVTLAQPPRYLSLYQRLLAGGSGYWARSSATDAQYDITIESLTGVPDDIMLALAETSALSHWKTQELGSASLSVRELVRRGDVIEQRLRRATGPLPVESRTSMRRGSQDSLGSHSSASPASLATSSEQSSDVRRLVVDAFREAGLLYLSTVLSGSVPGVPEVLASVKALAGHLSQLAPSYIDRALMLPLCLGGSLSDDMARRDFFRARLLSLRPYNGNAANATTVMEDLWHRRDTRGGVFDWRQTMRDRHMNLLLV